MSGRPQHAYGTVARANWGASHETALYTVGDLIWIPEGAASVLSGRTGFGLHRVESCFSIDECASFYYRVCRATIIGSKGSLRIATDWNDCSDRVHVIVGGNDFTAGWLLLHAEPKIGEA